MLSKIISTNWGLDVKAIKDAPRQFVAKTYFVETDRGKFFCKVIDKPLFIPGVVNSLSTLKEMHDLGLNRINFPIPTLNHDLFVMFESILVVLFNYIDAPQSYTYDNALFGKLLAEIHELTPRVKAVTPKETFIFRHDAVFREKLNSFVNLQNGSIAERTASKLLKDNYQNLIVLYNKFQTLSANCREKSWEMVLTHGDAPGNILVKASDDFYIVDWDDILLAPAERDVWFLLDKVDFIDGYRQVKKEFKADEEAATYYLFSRYFNDLVEYWAEIFGKNNEDHKVSNFNQMRKELFSEDGWLYQPVKAFI